MVAWLCANSLAEAIFASQFVRLDYNVYTGSIFRHTAFVELFDDRPITTANFLQYVNAGKYDFSMMHRLVPGGVLQGGGFYPQFVSEPQLSPIPYSFNPNAVVDLDGNSATSNPTIVNEFANSPARLNVRGTLAMAQSPGMPNSASNQWFLNLADNPGLDIVQSGSGPYTVFGRVAGDGMTYIDDLISNFSIYNMNPDADNNGTRESGPFYRAAGDGTPLYYQSGSLSAMQIVNTDQIDYFGAGTSTLVDGSWSISARNAVIDTGAVFTGPSGLSLSAGRTLQTRENYSLGRDLGSHGIVDPGLQIGKLTVNNYFQFADGTLKIEIAGPTADTQYDRLIATGGAFLAGTLDVTFLNNYSPALNTSFSIINSNSITGSFTFFELPNLAAGLVWRINRSGTAYTLTVAGGDYNRNGIVDAADYILWRETRGTSVTPGTGADGDSNGQINDNDYLVWRNNLGNVRGIAAGSGAGLTGAAVPEPGTILLLATAGLLFTRRPTRSDTSHRV
jgi:cyclophilin family peptidyl-prolyl cis-trans isomerase